MVHEVPVKRVVPFDLLVKLERDSEIDDAL